MTERTPAQLKAQLLLLFSLATEEDILDRLKDIHGLTEALVSHLHSLTRSLKEKTDRYRKGMSEEEFFAVFNSMREERSALRELLEAFDEPTLHDFSERLWMADQLMPPDGIGQTMRLVLDCDWCVGGRVQQSLGFVAAASLGKLREDTFPPEDRVEGMRKFAFSSTRGAGSNS